LYERWILSVPFGFKPFVKLVELENKDKFGYKTYSWIEANILKIKYFIEFLEDNKDGLIILCSDIDIRFLDQSNILYKEANKIFNEKDNLDMWIMPESQTKVNNGLFFVRNNNKIRQFLKGFLLLDLTLQSYFNNNISSLNYEKIPSKYIVWSNLYENISQALIHHPVCCKNIEEKLKQQDQILKLKSSIISIVIARYNEDIRWINSLNGVNIFLYNKGEDDIKRDEDINYLYSKISNIGRESHTYIYHLVDQYDNIKNNPNGVTFFTQANPRDHINMNLINLYIKEAFENGFSESLAKVHLNINPWSIPNPNFTVKDWPRGSGRLVQPNIYNENFQEWFERVMEKPFPMKDFRWIVGGIFAVRNDNILKRDKQYYEKLLEEFRDFINPEIGHFWERSWFYFFFG